MSSHIISSRSRVSWFGRALVRAPPLLDQSMKAGGEVGGTSPPLPFRRRGAHFHRKVARGASFGARVALYLRLMAHAHMRRILAEQVGHERTGEAHH